MNRTHLEVSCGSHPCVPEPEPVFSELVAGSALAMCLGWTWEAGGRWRSSNLLAVESPEPEGEKSVSPVARFHMGSREGHDRKKDKVKVTGSSQDRVPSLVVLHDSDIRV